MRTSPATATDGIDNDGDGLIDAEDPAESGRFSRLLRVASVSAAAGATAPSRSPRRGPTPGQQRRRQRRRGRRGGAVGRLRAGLGRGRQHSRVFAGSQHRLFAIFRTDDVGANWTAQPSPGTTDGAGGFHGIHSGAQGDTHFAMVVDPRMPTCSMLAATRSR